MRDDDPAALQTAATDDCTDLQRRDVDALRRCMTVLEEAPDLYEVVSDSGKAYTVELDLGVCTCPDHEYRNTYCIHQRRVAFATGQRPIPAWVDRDAVDEQLGIQVDGPEFATADQEEDILLADGGEIIVANDDAELVDEAQLPQITVQYEPAEQGGRRYWRCGGWGRESVYGRESIAHTDECPRRRR